MMIAEYLDVDKQDPCLHFCRQAMILKSFKMIEKIEEINSLKEALKDLHFDTWILFDLDNTVMQSQIALGGDPWFEGLFAEIKQKNLDVKLMTPSLMAVYNCIQHFVCAKPVEPSIVKIIHILQRIGLPVIGLTARGKAIREATLRQLLEIGVDFSLNSLVLDDAEQCLGGVIFCDGQDKGQQFNHFLKKKGQYPEHVVMFDDKRKHLEAMACVMNTLGIEFHGFRYSHLDEEVKRFDMQKAHAELAQLCPHLSSPIKRDIDALQLVPDALKAAEKEEKLPMIFFQKKQQLSGFFSAPAVDEEWKSSKSKFLSLSAEENRTDLELKLGI